MKLFSLLTLLLSIVALNGCSTTYQASGFTGGYTETWLAEDVVRVEFIGNGYTSASKATDLSMLRIAELAGKKGYNHFIFISSENQVESSTTAPTYTATTTGNTTSMKQTGGGWRISKPSTSNLAKLFKEKPFNVNGLIFSVDFVCNSITTKWQLKNVTCKN